MADWSFGETLLVARTVGEALRSIGADWHVGGLVANSVHGTPRATQGADIVAALRPGHGERLAELLGEAFYIDADTAEIAIRSRRSFNVIHLETMFRVDVFVHRQDAYGVRAMADRLLRVVSDETPISLPVATPEDTEAHKPCWYRRADEKSEKQWRDLIGVLKTLRGRIDEARLRIARSDLEVDDLVVGALESAGAVPGA